MAQSEHPRGTRGELFYVQSTSWIAVQGSTVACDRVCFLAPAQIKIERTRGGLVADDTARAN